MMRAYEYDAQDVLLCPARRVFVVCAWLYSYALEKISGSASFEVT